MYVRLADDLVAPIDPAQGHPSKVQHDVLVALVEKTQKQIGCANRLHSFLTSDLGTHLPLHISLSKPLSLPASIKDDFLDSVEESIRSGGMSPFSIKPAGLAWHKSPDSDRSFFVLRVATASIAMADKHHDGGESLMQGTNPELMQLLVKCNKVATNFGQPPLYQQTHDELAHAAFHISIGWTLGRPDDETCLEVLGNFKDNAFREIHSWHIPVDTVKTKIGNVVSRTPLTLTRPGKKEGVDNLIGV